jgi:hypothetical protein
VLNKSFFALREWWLAAMLASGTLLASEHAVAQAEESVDAQQTQAVLQEQIDTADEQTRAQLEELRRLERETQQLAASNASLAGRLAEEADRQQRLATALDTLEETRAALPVIEQNMSAQLSQWIERDLPFLRDERLARVERQPDEQGKNTVERINELLETWRVELDYGREMDSWRGRLRQDDHEREVDFLRIGRIGFYYLTPDGREGGVWNAEESTWQPLSDEYLREVRNGLRMADDQRAPDLLTLPLSISVNDQQGEQP